MTDESGMISHATAEPLVQHVMNLCKQGSELQNFLFLLTSPTYLEQSGDGKNLTCFGEEFVPLFNWQIVVFWVSFEVSSTYMVHICQVQIILLRASIGALTFDVIYGAVSSCKNSFAVLITGVQRHGSAAFQIGSVPLPLHHRIQVSRSFIRIIYQVNPTHQQP